MAAVEQGALPAPQALYLYWVFAHRPSRYIHPSWAASLPHGELLQWLLRQPRSERALSRHLAQQLELGPVEWTALASGVQRLALAPPNELGQLLWRVGLVRRAQALRRLLLRDEVAAAKAQIGAEGYQFALHRAPLLLAVEAAADPIDPLRPAPSTEGSAPWRDWVAESGLRELRGQWQALPPAAGRRVALKFSQQEWQAAAAAPPPTTLDAAALYKLIKEFSTPCLSLLV